MSVRVEAGTVKPQQAWSPWQRRATDNDPGYTAHADEGGETKVGMHISEIADICEIHMKKCRTRSMLHKTPRARAESPDRTPVQRVERIKKGWGDNLSHRNTNLKIFETKCLNVSNGATADGTKLQIWTCAVGNTNQMWTFSGNTIQWSGEWAFQLLGSHGLERGE
ncbi:hypothetical protein B0H14DRAFT_3632990 [Mycena olivaceomarginata]|nr:hypothetical protein B0H14DRAFT_3632990 [Mycena olivaceomarginata]